MSPPAADDHDPEQTPRRPRTRPIASTVLVIGFLVLLAGMILPALNMDASRENHHHNCGNNQRQIILSAMLYANDNDQLWPCRPTDAHGHATTDPAAIDGFCTAAASLELLMVRNTDLPLKIFACPQNTSTLQYLASPQANGMGYSQGQSQWGQNHAATTPGGPGALAYAYDWSAPTNTSAIRVMITDRGNLTVAHKKCIMAAAGDGHVLTINLTDEEAHRPPGTHITMDLDGNPEMPSFAAKDSSVQAARDDVYDDQGDDGHMDLPAQGSATRCWVR